MLRDVARQGEVEHGALRLSCPTPRPRHHFPNDWLHNILDGLANTTGRSCQVLSSEAARVSSAHLSACGVFTCPMLHLQSSVASRSSSRLQDSSRVSIRGYCGILPVPRPVGLPPLWPPRFLRARTVGTLQAAWICPARKSLSNLLSPSCRRRGISRILI